MRDVKWDSQRAAGAKLVSYRRRLHRIHVNTTPFYVMCLLGLYFESYLLEAKNNAQHFDFFRILTLFISDEVFYSPT